MPDPGNLSWKNPECRYSFSFEPIRESCLENIMKSPSLDSKLHVLDIDSELLRIAAALSTPSVTRILNHSLISGVVPQDWKIARVTPVHKGKGDKNDRSNYRPLSVLGSISMILEREVHSQILSYFTKHDLITIDQFAFLKKHSTTGCLHRVIDDWYEVLNESEFVMACFFDIKKCFDSINHAILLRELALYGIRGPELQWFKNYLSGRRQSVSCNGSNSGICNISTGVPQGSHKKNQIKNPLLLPAYIISGQNTQPTIHNLLKEI